MDSAVKQEKPDFIEAEETNRFTFNFSPIDISSGSSSSSSGSDSEIDFSFLDNAESESNRKRNLNEFEDGYLLAKKQKIESLYSGVVLPPGFLSFLPPNCTLAPLPLNYAAPETVTEAEPLNYLAPETVTETFELSPVADSASNESEAAPVFKACKQFWKAGDYEGGNAGDSSTNSVGMDHVRVHPKFLHSNATSHKWALGAFAELLDNSLDEVCYGATYVRVDLLKNKKDGTHMLLFEDNGGGMTPDKMRQCMSLGYSAKSKMANTIGQYGNGFKTSTMRLGADVIVFSRCQGNDGKSPTQSIGLLSYTFLRGTGKEDIVVPMIDYEKRGESWNMMVRSSPEDWSRNLETIAQWSPYMSEEDLTQQFNFLKDQGTRIIVYNLWEDDEGNLELDFDSDPRDIQLRGVNREEKNIEMAKKYPNSRHFLTYRHSLRSYASILYLRLPPSFRITLRGKDVDHHNIVDDMMLTKKIRYKPLYLPESVPKDLNMVATVTIGFVKDARHHIDIQGFNVYHKNRLIKPFWRVWNAAGSDGRGAIGVLEANFVEPAHDKQGFERTPVLARLEARLVAIQKDYWCENCQEVGYAPRRHSKNPVSAKTESRTSDKDKSSVCSNKNIRDCNSSKMKCTREVDKRSLENEAIQDGNCNEASPASAESQRDPRLCGRGPRISNRLHSKATLANGDGQVLYNSNTESSIKSTEKNHSQAAVVNGDGQVLSNSNTESLIKSKEENHESRERRLRRKQGPTREELLNDLQHERLKTEEGPTKDELLNDLQHERERSRSLENQLKEVQNELREAKKKTEESIDEHSNLLDIFESEIRWRDEEQERLKKRMREASNTIRELLEKVKRLEDRLWKLQH